MSWEKRLTSLICTHQLNCVFALLNLWSHIKHLNYFMYPLGRNNLSDVKFMISPCLQGSVQTVCSSKCTVWTLCTDTTCKCLSMSVLEYNWPLTNIALNNSWQFNKGCKTKSAVYQCISVRNVNKTLCQLCSVRKEHVAWFSATVWTKRAQWRLRICPGTFCRSG